MATVFRATDKRLRRDVAVKILFPHLARKPDVVSRFQREARAAAALDHPNILRVLDVGGGQGSPTADTLSDPPYLVLELIEGGSLRDRFDDIALPAESVAAIGAVLCRALGAAHAAGIVHRDVKPANIMATRSPNGEPRLVVADFGVAHVSGQDSVVTRTGALLGTPAYMSPEQTTAEPLDARSDVYSLGATLYKLATSVMPFTGPTTKVVTSIMSGEYIRPLRRKPSMGPDLARVIEKMMATDPDDRFDDATEAGRALTEVLEKADIAETEAVEAALVGETETIERAALARTLERAENAADEGRIPIALALADRALALEPNHPRALAIIDRVSKSGGGAWKLAAGAGVIALVACAGLVATGTVFDDSGPLSFASPSAVPAEVEGDAAPSIADAGIAADVVAVVATVDAGRAPASRASGKDEKPKPTREKPSPDRTPEDEPPADRQTPVDAGAVAAVLPSKIEIPTAPVPPAKKEAVVLTVASWCDLSINGDSKGRVVKKRTVKLAPGTHKLACAGSSGAVVRKTLTVRAGRSAAVSFTQLVSVTVNVGDGVAVGGRFHKRGARFRMAPGRVPVTVYVGKERKVLYVTIASDCVLGGTSKLICSRR